MPTAIEWCDETFNPWWGCAEVSPGCGHCYARTWAAFTKAKLGLWPEHGQPSTEHGFMVTSDGYWRRPHEWARTLPAQLGRRPRIFCASMADVFEKGPDDGNLLDPVRDRLFDLIEATPEIDWLILTKRPEFAGEYLRSWYAMRYAETDLVGRATRIPLPNVWVGVSIENARFTWRADVLREIPAAVRFISAEPLLGSLYECSPDITVADNQALRGRYGPDAVIARLRVAASDKRRPLDLTGIDWIIVGGESGPGARPFHLEHAHEIIRAARCPNCTDGQGWFADHDDQCYEDGSCSCSGIQRQCWDHRDGPAIFVKQLGARPIDSDLVDFPLVLRDRKHGGDIDEWPADLRIREFPRSAA